MRAAIAAFALPGEAIEAMLDARLTEIAPPDGFTLAAFERYAAESEGARLRLASRIAAGGQDLDRRPAHAPAGVALGASPHARRPAVQAGAGPTLFPVDVAERHGAAPQTSTPAGASAGVVAA